jgi:DNA-binding transcriptional regulator YiaG
MRVFQTRETHTMTTPIIPTPAEVRAAREAAGLTQTAAATLVHVDLRSWQRWESGERTMSPAHWELFGIKAKGL